MAEVLEREWLKNVYIWGRWMMDRWMGDGGRQKGRKEGKVYRWVDG